MKPWHSTALPGFRPPSAAPSGRRRLPWRRLWARTWWWAALATLALMASATALRGRLDLLVYDLLVPTHRLAQPVVVIGIDEASLEALGPWPWPRALHAQMIDRLQAAGAAAIGYDLIFSEPTRSGPDADARLAQAIAGSGRVVLPIAPLAGEAGRGEQAPLSALARGARLGHVDVEIDRDGVARGLFLQAGVETPRYPAFVRALQRQVQGDGAASQELPSVPPAAASVRAGDAVLPATPSWVRAQPILLPEVPQAPPTLSFAQALQMPDLVAHVEGRVVLVGVVAQGLSNPIVSSMRLDHTQMPAVLFQARAYDALASGAAIVPMPVGGVWGLALLLLGGMLLWPAPRQGRGLVRLLPVLLVALPVALSALLLLVGRWWPPVATTAALGAGYAVWLARQVRATADAMRRARREAHATLHAIGEAVVRLDVAGRIEYLNPVARRLAQQSDARGLVLDEAFALDAASAALLADALAGCLRQRRPARASGYLRLTTLDGALVVLRATISPLLGAYRRPEGVVIALADMTEAVEAANRLDHAASHDALTGLPNRSLLADRLTHAVTRAQRTRRLVALLFVDLDRFKRINDSLGHRHGDVVLQVTAQRLKDACRANDTVIRWGGDEFVVLLEDLPGREAASIATAKLVEVVSQDIEIEGLSVPCTCSVGVSLAPQDGSDPDALLAMADAAMYRAKSQPNERYQFFSSELNVWTRDRLALEAGLRQALSDGRFELHYQPQFDLRHHRLVGFEALLRWQREDGEELTLPGTFISVAEESGLILQLGDWALRDAARQLARWQAEGLPLVPVGINVSARQCMDHRIVGVLRETLAETGIAPHLLKLEITESTAMADVEHVAALLHEIRALGVGLAVDDFGTGYSSLSHLKRFPIDEIKIDRSFVRDITTDQNDAAIVRATIALAHGLGLPVVAEGVEHEAQRRFLARQRCDVMQGFLCGRPRNAADTTRWMLEEHIEAEPVPRRRGRGRAGAGSASDRQRELWAVENARSSVL